MVRVILQQNALDLATGGIDQAKPKYTHNSSIQKEGAQKTSKVITKFTALIT